MSDSVEVTTAPISEARDNTSLAAPAQKLRRTDDVDETMIADSLDSIPSPSSAHIPVSVEKNSPARRRKGRSQANKK